MAARHALLIGNSDGIGLALTERLLREGWRVTGLSRSASRITQTGYAHHVLDVSAAVYREALRSATESAPIDVCVYCAAIGELFDPDVLTAEGQTFRVNLVGAVETAEVVLPAMIARGAGHFVALSSIGDGVSTAAPAYAASKAGLSSYLGGLALALRPRGVHVSNVRFGFVDTKMAKSKAKPMMITTELAVERLMRCLERRPARMTHPWRMGLLVALLDGITAIRLWLA